MSAQGKGHNPSGREASAWQEREKKHASRRKRKGLAPLQNGKSLGKKSAVEDGARSSEPAPLPMGDRGICGSVSVMSAKHEKTNEEGVRERRGKKKRFRRGGEIL